MAGPAGLAGALALSACLTDSPNRTGGEYLERHGLLLETPLHRIEVKDFPVDSFFVRDIDPGRLGDSLLLAGRWRGFTADARLAFDVNDTNHLDSLADTANLRLSLSFPIPNRGADALKAMVEDVESMTFLVESWAFDFSHTDKSRADSLRALNQRFLVRLDTSALFPEGARQLDTIRVAVKTAYAREGGRDSVQVFPLPGLRKKLAEGSESGRQWIVLMQLTHMPEDSADTAAMLRFGGNYGPLYSPALLFGNPEGTAGHPGTATAKQKVSLLTVNHLDPARRGGHTRFRHAGSETALLTGMTRGLHLRLNRSKLLDSLDQALRRMGDSLVRASDGEFDLGYYVPFAQLTVPLAAPSAIEGGFPVDLRLVSDLDSLLPGDAMGMEHFLPEGTDETLVVQFARNNRARPADSVMARFEDVEGVPDLHRFILWGKDTARKDTTFLRDGETREVFRGTPGALSDRLVFTVQAHDDSLSYRMHINTKGMEEGHLFRDAATGKNLDDLASRIPRFLKPQDSTLSLRATFGFQRMLNRARLGQGIESDFFIQPIRNAAADTASKLPLPYPVLGEVEPEIVAGRLGVDIVLYLYPLKAR